MRTCPHCGSRNILRDIPGSRFGIDLKEFFQYYRCKSCDGGFRVFAMDEFFRRVANATGNWYMGYAVFILFLLVALNYILNSGSDQTTLSVTSLTPY